jgi:hypothetical protein
MRSHHSDANGDGDVHAKFTAFLSAAAPEPDLVQNADRTWRIYMVSHHVVSPHRQTIV